VRIVRKQLRQNKQDKDKLDRAKALIRM